MVGAGMGVALVPRMAMSGARGRTEPVRDEGGAAAVAVRVLRADQPRRHVVAAVRRGAEGAPGLARVLAALRRVAEEAAVPPGGTAL